MTVEKTQKRLSAIRKHITLAFLGAISGVLAAGYYSPSRPVGAGFAELHARVWIYDNVQQPIGTPAPAETLQLVSFFSDPVHFQFGQAELTKLLWHIAGGGIAGAIAGLMLMTFIAHPSLILRFFKSGVEK